MNKQLRQHGVPFALVQHANQYLITNGYDNRQGIHEIVEGYTRILLAHERYGIPLNLHLSGTLIEAIAWHCPWFLELVRTLRSKGIVSLIGGTYAENIMTLFQPSFNLRQLNEHLWLYRRHLHCQPDSIKICWVPERVWNSELLAETLASPMLANGGYRYVLLDDRLLYPTYGVYTGSPRALFDASRPYHPYPSEATSSCTESSRAYSIAGAGGLAMIPISSNLRYWIPPACDAHWQCLDSYITHLAHEKSRDTLLIYADDLEKSAGAGGWDAYNPERYEAFLRWVASRNDLLPIHLAGWLEHHPPKEERMIEQGSFFEIAQGLQAGEDYRVWWEDSAWLPYRRILEDVQESLLKAGCKGADEQLLALAWKHVMASTYETAWHDSAGGRIKPAGWAKAAASHARAAYVMLAAARWFAQSERPASVELVDIDEDGEEEVILRNASLYAVIAPRHGARLIYLFTLTAAGGALVIGNPTDDWNYQQELNAYMRQPPNHAGALADTGYEDDAYAIIALQDGKGVSMRNIQAGSRLYGAEKSISLLAQGDRLAIRYCLPPSLTSLDTIICFSPDYYRLLREGHTSVSAIRGGTRRGFCNGEICAWVDVRSHDESCWVPSRPTCVGHGLSVQLRFYTSQMDFVIGCGWDKLGPY